MWRDEADPIWGGGKERAKVSACVMDAVEVDAVCVLNGAVTTINSLH